MPVTTGQQIAQFYNQFHNVEVTFTREVVQATQLNTRQVYLKCLGFQWPCVVYSTSLVEARVILNTGGSVHETIRSANNLVSLRFSFMQRDKTDPLAFFVSARISGYTRYGDERPDLVLATLNYTQRPPDDMIDILGQLLEANLNFKRRREERITMTADSTVKLGIRSKESTIEIEGVPRRGIIRDLSFCGAKVIILGIAKLLVGKSAVLHVDIVDPPDTILIPGKVIRFEPVEGRDDIAAFAVAFDEEQVPIAYKLRINAYLKATKTAKKVEDTHGPFQ